MRRPINRRTQGRVGNGQTKQSFCSLPHLSRSSPSSLWIKNCVFVRQAMTWQGGTCHRTLCKQLNYELSACHTWQCQQLFRRSTWIRFENLNLNTRQTMTTFQNHRPDWMDWIRGLLPPDACTLVNFVFRSGWGEHEKNLAFNECRFLATSPSVLVCEQEGKRSGMG